MKIAFSDGMNEINVRDDGIVLDFLPADSLRGSRGPDTKIPLHNKRMGAAIASRGISSDVIYKLAISLLNSLQSPGDLLEYGAGTGSLIKCLLDSNYRGKITGTDIFARPAFLPNDVHWIQSDLNNSLEIPDESFDAIVSTEVIEHLENPRATFREFHRLLRPHGTIIITTPNQESVRSFCCLLAGGHFAAFLEGSYPAHITALLRKDFGRICLESGFSVPSFHYTNAGGIPKLPSIRWQEVSFGLLKGRLFSDNVAVVATKNQAGANRDFRRSFH
jgi:2-polyprenyl-3-methyl-5-hydroxy-6-metoxy-1,4-benzoquinol methylase